MTYEDPSEEAANKACSDPLDAWDERLAWARPQVDVPDAPADDTTISRDDDDMIYETLHDHCGRWWYDGEQFERGMDVFEDARFFWMPDLFS